MSRQRLRLRTRWWIGIRVSDLPPMTRLVALTLAGWADQDGNRARPSQSSIAAGCGLKRRVVVDHIKKLADAGWVWRTHGRGIPNTYTLTIPMPIEGQIEAVLGEWNGEEVGHGGALPDDEVGHLGAPSRTWGRTNQGMGVHTSLTEPDIKPPTQADLTPPWVALGISYQEWNRQGQPLPPQEQERSEEETRPNPVAVVEVSE